MNRSLIPSNGFSKTMTFYQRFFLPRRCWNDQHSWPYLGGQEHGFDHVPLAGHLPRNWCFFSNIWQWIKWPSKKFRRRKNWNIYGLEFSTLNGLMMIDVFPSLNKHYLFSPRCAMKKTRTVASSRWFELTFWSWFCGGVGDALNSKFVQLKIDWDHSWWGWFQIVLLNRFPVYMFCSRERGRNEIRCCGCAYLFAFTGHLIHGVLVRNTFQHSPQHLNVRKLRYFA